MDYIAWRVEYGKKTSAVLFCIKMEIDFIYVTLLCQLELNGVNLLVDTTNAMSPFKYHNWPKYTSQWKYKYLIQWKKMTLNELTELKKNNDSHSIHLKN